MKQGTLVTQSTTMQRRESPYQHTPWCPPLRAQPHAPHLASPPLVAWPLSAVRQQQLPARCAGACRPPPLAGAAPAGPASSHQSPQSPGDLQAAPPKKCFFQNTSCHTCVNESVSRHHQQPRLTRAQGTCEQHPKTRTPDHSHHMHFFTIPFYFEASGHHRLPYVRQCTSVLLWRLDGCKFSAVLQLCLTHFLGLELGTGWQ